MMLPLGAVDRRGDRRAVVRGALSARTAGRHIVSFFVGENVERYTAGLGVDSERGPLFYLPVVFSDSFPVVAVPGAGRRRLRGGDARAGEAMAPPQRVRTLLLAVDRRRSSVFFSLSAGKQDLYIFPIVPAVAALAGVMVAGAATAAAARGPPWRSASSSRSRASGVLASVRPAARASTRFDGGVGDGNRRARGRLDRECLRRGATGRAPRCWRWS